MADTASGVLRLAGKSAGVLRDPARSLHARPNDVQVPAALIRQHRLSEGAAVSGPVRKEGGRPVLAAVESVCGLPPEEFAHRTAYKDLVAVDPCERFRLGDTGDVSMRVVDLVAPIGKGTRSLIVSPPKAGKTMLLEKMAGAIRASDPDTRIIVLLIDERPEEVTQFRRAVDAEVLASSNDQTIKEHVELSELTLAHIRAELECGRDVVVLLDSLTRMGRSFNLKGSGSRRTMSGGLDAGALEIPRRFFGMARNIEGGGSITIVATALVDTGSRMDQIIFEEFKGTGNSELVLDRALSEARIFPAVDIAASGTRKEALLYNPEEGRRITAIRRALAGLSPLDATTALIRMVEKYPTNEELLASLPMDA